MSKEHYSKADLYSLSNNELVEKAFQWQEQINSTNEKETIVLTYEVDIKIPCVNTTLVSHCKKMRKSLKKTIKGLEKELIENNPTENGSSRSQAESLIKTYKYSEDDNLSDYQRGFEQGKRSVGVFVPK